MAQTILYYPTIDIQDGQWLRNAVLYWDKVASIVPYDNYSDYSPEVLYLKECEIYNPIFPQLVFSSEYATDFFSTIIRRIERSNKNFEIKTEPYKAQNDHGQIIIHNKKIYNPALFDHIHHKKFPSNLLDYLVDKRYAKYYKDNEWLEIESRIAEIYMRTLAEFAVKSYSEDIVLGTDKFERQHDIYSHARPQFNTVCLSLEFNNCLPRPIPDIGFEQLLDFKERRKQEFQQFRKKLRELENNLSKCSNNEEIRFRTEEFKESWQREIIQTQKMFKADRIPFILGSLYTLISVPSTAAAIDQLIQSHTPGLWNPIASYSILGGTAFIGVGCQFVNYRNRVNSNNKNSGFAYLIKGSRDGIIKSF